MSGPERRIDPEDGGAYTYEQIFQFYQRQYPPNEISQYWAMMRPVGFENDGPQEFRFEQGDRVLCNVGQRRLVGAVLSKDVEDPEEPNGPNLAYVVKTDAIPGAVESNTISAPEDVDEVICRERCFHVTKEVKLTKWAAPIVPEEKRKPLRYALGDPVSIRVQDKPDGYEQWAYGRVSEVWPELPGRVVEGFMKTAGAVPYKVETDDQGAFYCHRDEHTLIRHPENAPKVPGKTISKRFENRPLPDGGVERFDHVTLRGKRVTVQEE